MSVPTAIAAKVISQLHDKKYRIVWNASDISVTSYNVYRSETMDGTFTKIISVVDDTQYFDSLPIDWNSTNVFYKVTAVNVDGESTLTATSAVTDTDVNSYMYVPRELNIKQYGDDSPSIWLYNIVPLPSYSITTTVTNGIFYLNYNYRPGSLEIYLNRLKLEASKFTESGSNFFTILSTLTVGSVLDCNFRK